MASGSGASGGSAVGTGNADASPSAEQSASTKPDASEEAQPLQNAYAAELSQNADNASHSGVARWWWILVAAGAIALGAGTAAVIRRRG